MKIGISGYIGKKKTGIGRVLENNLLHIAAADTSNMFYVFVNYDQDNLFATYHPSNIVLVKYRVSKNSPILNILWHQLGYQFKLKRYKCDVSFIPNFSLLLWKTKPTVVIIHDLIEFNVRSKFSKLRMFYRRVADPLMAKISDKIITVSYTSKNDILKYLNPPDAKVKVIYNGYDKTIFKLHGEGEIREFLHSYHLGFRDYILYVGTIDHPGKNLYSLLVAFIQLKEESKISEKLVIVGQKGFNSSVLFELIEKSKYKNDIIVLGFVDDKNLAYLYNGAKLFGYLSLYEGFGLPVIEAMACGCPVISSNTSAIKEITSDFGVIVDPLNIKEIKLNVETLINSDELCEKFRILGLEYVSKFDLYKIAEEYLKEFEALYKITNN